jgi:hypothetical protein
MSADHLQNNNGTAMARIVPPLLLVATAIFIAYFIIFRSPTAAPPIATQPPISAPAPAPAP